MARTVPSMVAMTTTMTRPTAMPNRGRSIVRETNRRSAWWRDGDAPATSSSDGGEGSGGIVPAPSALPPSAKKTKDGRTVSAPSSCPVPPASPVSAAAAGSPDTAGGAVGDAAAGESADHRDGSPRSRTFSCGCQDDSTGTGSWGTDSSGNSAAWALAVLVELTGSRAARLATVSEPVRRLDIERRTSIARSCCFTDRRSPQTGHHVIRDSRMATTSRAMTRRKMLTPRLPLSPKRGLRPRAPSSPLKRIPAASARRPQLERVDRCRR